MKKRVCLVLALAWAASQAIAQVNSLQGLTEGLRGPSAGAMLERAPWKIYSDAVHNPVEDVQWQYDWSLGSRFVLSVGLRAGLGHLKTGAVNGMEFSNKDRTTLRLLPSFALSDSALLYATLSTLTVTGNAKSAGTQTTYGLHGYGYGVGLRVVDQAWFFQTAYDLERQNLNGTLSLQPASSLFSLGAGYRF